MRPVRPLVPWLALACGLGLGCDGEAGGARSTGASSPAARPAPLALPRAASGAEAPGSVTLDAPADGPARAAARSVVMVMVAAPGQDAEATDWRGVGSGVVLSREGAILTSLHVVYDEARHELHDRFAIARSRGIGRQPVAACTGRTRDGVFDEALDLALLRCDQEIVDRDWEPLARADEIPEEGSQVVVLGYPERHGQRLALARGAISCVTPDARELCTDATVLPGMSGGAALDARGRLVGVLAAYRYRIHVAAERAAPAEVERIGRIQPVARARAWLDRNLASQARSR